MTEILSGLLPTGVTVELSSNGIWAGPSEAFELFEEKEPEDVGARREEREGAAPKPATPGQFRFVAGRASSRKAQKAGNFKRWCKAEFGMKKPWHSTGETKEEFKGWCAEVCGGHPWKNPWFLVCVSLSSRLNP
jgi:hypothetical protein